MRVGLVLGAGGVTGHAFHSGVLGAIAERTGWDPRRADVVVGTSAGSIVAAMLRGGVAGRDLDGWRGGAAVPPDVEIVAGRARPPAAALARAALTMRPGIAAAALLPRGTRPTAAIGAGVRALHRDSWPTEEVRICAVRRRDGARVVFGDPGAPAVSLATAVEASCAIPGWFAPVVIRGQEMVDGGAHSPTNADVLVRWRGRLDAVVVSSPMSLDRAAARRPSPDTVLRLGHRASLAREVAALRLAGVRRIVTFQPSPEDLAVMGGTAAAMDRGRHGDVLATARATTLRRLDAGAWW